MSDKYSVDDILNEVKSMKSGSIFIEKDYEKPRKKEISSPAVTQAEKPVEQMHFENPVADKPTPAPTEKAEAPSVKLEKIELPKKNGHIDYSHISSDDFFKMIEQQNEEKIVGGFKVQPLHNTVEKTEQPIEPEPTAVIEPKPVETEVKTVEKNEEKTEEKPLFQDENASIKDFSKTIPTHKISISDELFKKSAPKSDATQETIAFTPVKEKEFSADSTDILDSGIAIKNNSFKDGHKPEHMLSPSEINSNQMNETMRFKLNDTVIDLSKKDTHEAPSVPFEEPKTQDEIVSIDENEPSFDDLDFGFSDINTKSDVEEFADNKQVGRDITYTDDYERPEKKHEAFARKTKRRVENEKFDYSDENSGSEEVIDDYCTIDDAESVQFDLDTSSSKISKRILFTLLALLLSGVVSGNFIGAISETQNTGNFFIANAIVLAFAVLVNAGAIFRGLFSLITFKPDVDSALSVAFLATAVQSVCGFFFTNTVSAKDIPMFTSAACLAAVLNLFGKRSMISRIKHNFKNVATTTVKQSCFVADDRMGEMLEQDDFIGTPTVACSKSVINLQNYLYNSYCEDPSDNICKTLAPIGLLVSIATLVITYFLTKDIMSAVSYFAAVAVICVPATALLCANVPLNSAAKKMRRKGGLITGYNAVNEFADVDCVTINSEELFPAGAVELLSLRAIGDVSIEDVILKSAALTINAGGPLADVFDKIIDGRRKMLPPVDNIFFEDAMGLTGTIEGKTIRIGNRAFMDAYGIYGLSDETIDQKAKQNGSFVVYTSIEDEVCGMFAVKYKSVDADVDESVYNLVRSGITIAVKTNDPNVTPELIGKVFDIPSEYIVVMPAHIVEHYDEMTKPAQNGDSIIAHNNNISAFASILIACKKLRTKILSGVILQTILTLVGFGGAMLYSVTGDNFSILTPANIVVFQVICTVIVLLASAVIKRIR